IGKRLAALEKRQFQAEYQHIEALRFFAVSSCTGRERCDTFQKFVSRGVVECLPAFRLLIFLDEPAVLTDDEIVDAHSTHIVPQDLYGFTAHSLQRRWVTRADKVFFRFSEACRHVEAGLFVNGAHEVKTK